MAREVPFLVEDVDEGGYIEVQCTSDLIHLRFSIILASEFMMRDA